MAKFTDCLNREWTLRLTLGHRAALRDLGVDTTNLGTVLASLTQATGADADKLVSVCLPLVVEPLTREELEKGLDAVAIDAMGEALADAVADFYLSRRPQMAAAAKGRLREVMAKMDAEAAERLTRLPLDISSPDSAGSTPAPTP